jgi:predicted extracellular nuclease
MPAPRRVPEVPAVLTTVPVRRSLVAIVALVLAASLLPWAIAQGVRANGGIAELFFSEYIEGSSNNKALEIHNGTGGPVDLAAGGYDVQMYFNGSSTAGLTISLAGTVAAGDVFVLAQSAADPVILAQADQTNGSGWFNGDDAVVLRKGETIVDSFGQVGFDPGTEWGSGLVSTQDNTLRRMATVCAGDAIAGDAFDPAVQWDGYATNTFDGLGSHATTGCGGTGPAVLINEFSASTAGADVEYVEVLGAASTDLSAYTVLEIEGDTTGAGVIDEVIAIGTTDAGGFYLAALPANALENGTISLLLVTGFTGALGDDLDTDNDGTFDSTPWDAVVDSVAVNDGGAGDVTYGTPALGPNYDGVSSFAPGGASRIPDGTDTDTAADWVRNDFDLAGIPGFTGTPVLGEAYNTPGASNEAFVPPPEACGDPTTAIHDIQGSGASSPIVGTEVAVEGVVVGDYQGAGQFSGFYVQEEDAEADGDPATSEGIFVFNTSFPVDAGDQVRVRGTVTEFNGLTELGSVSLVLTCATGASVTPTEVTLPFETLDFPERYEGMLVTLPQTLVISEYFNYDRFGEMVLALPLDGESRAFTPTSVEEPGAPAQARALANSLRRITLDDGLNTQNPPVVRHPNGDPFSLTNLFRGGDTVTDTIGVLTYSFGLYRIEPTAPATYTAVNPRPVAPAPVGGDLRVASLNTLNYFLTPDYPGGSLDNACGPLQDMECRGWDADQSDELTRQRDKLLATLAGLDADIVGLNELENTTGVEPLADLVAGLDSIGAGEYAYVDTGTIGTDAIKVGLLYRPAVVTPVGDFAILDTSVDPRFLDDYNRPVLAQTFEENTTGARFTVAVNHLKSKGSSCNAVGDPDTGDGQGNCNLTRMAAAQALVDWLATDPTGSGDRDHLIIGDLNSYAMEDPIDAVKAGPDDVAGTADDYVNLIAHYQGTYAYSYVFDGQAGYLDHALASSTLAAQVTGAADWHINADESDLLDYDTSFKPPEQDAIYEPNAYRSSDHDPLVIGLHLSAYAFDGFRPPLSAAPADYRAKAGARIPVKWSLGGDFGLDVLAGAPKVYACDAWPLGPSVDAVTDPLTYDPSSDQYQLDWKTDKAWSGSCRTIEVRFVDGTYRLVNVDFR